MVLGNCSVAWNVRYVGENAAIFSARTGVLTVKHRCDQSNSVEINKPLSQQIGHQGSSHRAVAFANQILCGIPSAVVGKPLTDKLCNRTRIFKQTPKLPAFATR